jgi:type IV pilus assembly protein PilM
MEEKQLEQALPWEAQGKVPFDIHRARLRHIVAGEVYDGSDTKQEVILMAASHSVVEQHLSFIERTKVQIDSVNVEPCALVNCFSHLLNRQEENSGGVMLIDLGHSCTKAIITHGPDIVFCRTIGIAAEHMIRAICDRKGESYAQAVASQQNLSAEELTHAWRKVEAENQRVGVFRPAAKTEDDLDRESGEEKAAVAVEPETPDTATVIASTLRSMCEELRSCIRYHDLMFDSQRVERVIFVGGQAKNTVLCQQVAQSLGLPAQLGDPVARVDAATRTGKHSDLEPNERHSEWAVAFGLSLGGVKKK